MWGNLFFDLEDLTGLADAEALCVDIGSAEFVAGGNEATDVGTRRFFREAGQIEESELVVGCSGFVVQKRVCLFRRLGLPSINTPKNGEAKQAKNLSGVYIRN